MNTRIFLLTLTLPLLAVAPLSAQPQPEIKTLPEKLQARTQWMNPNYFFYRPAKAAGDEEIPLLIFLHGKGERGTNLEVIKQFGPPKHIARGTSYPFAVLAPQCTKDEQGKGWWNTRDLQLLLEHVVKSGGIDPKRIYLTGNSMGGFATWAWAKSYPEQFAAIAPICGGAGNDFDASALKKLPIWVFHGALDKVVPLERSQVAVDALREVGSDVKFTVYPKAKHNSWTRTYENPELYDWFLSHEASKGFQD